MPSSTRPRAARQDFPCACLTRPGRCTLRDGKIDVKNATSLAEGGRVLRVRGREPSRPQSRRLRESRRPGQAARWRYDLPRSTGDQGIHACTAARHDSRAVIRNHFRPFEQHGVAEFVREVVVLLRLRHHRVQHVVLLKGTQECVVARARLMHATVASDVGLKDTRCEIPFQKMRHPIPTTGSWCARPRAGIGRLSNS
jgi:hypothetical protein